MVYNNYIFNLLFIFIITILIGYIFGITIVSLIDNRLNKFNIKDVKSYESIDNIEDFKNKNKNNEVNREISISRTYNFETGEEIKNKDKEQYKKQDIEGYNNGFYKEWYVETKRTQVCYKNHNHSKDGSSTKCDYGVTNYSDPADMSPIDHKIFNLNYPPNMTLQDYINWLYCFMNKEDQLPYNHLKNLEKLKNGIELIQEEGILPPPGYYYPALNAKDYFDKMYNETNEFNIASPLNSTTGPMLGYNCNDYSEFSQNSDMYGQSGEIRNEDIYKKKNAKELYEYINPKDSNSLNINTENEIYHIKDVEI
jgi:hypothetical protein